MSKFGIGVGEEFPAGDPPPNNLEPIRPHRHNAWHFAFHITARVAFLALLIGALFWAFHSFGGPYPAAARWHAHFFPFFPILLLLVLLFVGRRRHYLGYGCGYGRRRWHDEMRYWHEEMHRDRGERT